MILSVSGRPERGTHVIVPQTLVELYCRSRARLGLERGKEGVGGSWSGLHLGVRPGEAGRPVWDVSAVSRALFHRA